MQKSKDECFLREVLYDSVIMADYSCFKSQQETLLPSDRLKNIAVAWLLIVDDAICFTRYIKERMIFHFSPGSFVT